LLVDAAVTPDKPHKLATRQTAFQRWTGRRQKGHLSGGCSVR
jgi:hypothetical protein